MTSQINPNLINGAYPVAGQDNSTQGMRDNFTNIKNNFQFAADEITALQNSTVAIGSGQNNDLGGALLYNYQTKNSRSPVVSWGNRSGSIEINWAASPFQTVIMTGNLSLTFVPASVSGLYSEVTLRVENSNSSPYTLTLPGSVTVNAAGVQGLNASTNTITFAAPGTYEFTFSTTDGSSYSLEETNKNLQPFNNTAEDLAANAAVSLSTACSYFTTSAAETATLAAGVEGQVKTLAMRGTNGNMVITVTNAGWKTSGTGTITFDAVGDACVLQYISSKWFCIGNNGCTFA